MKTNYSEAFVEQAVIKLLTRGQRTIREVALDLNVNYHTARNWTKKGAANKAVVAQTKEKRPQDWSAPEQLQALNETHALSGEALQAWCRERGVFAHHLASWKTAFCAPAKALADTGQWRSLKDENEQLRRELVRKEKALSEAAALLILAKKSSGRCGRTRSNDQPLAAPPGHCAGGRRHAKRARARSAPAGPLA